MLTREAILNQKISIKVEPIDVPEWGGICYLRAMTGVERDAYEAEQAECQKEGTILVNFRAKLLVKVMCDEQGNRLFQDGDADSLGQQSGALICRLFKVAARVNGLDMDQAEKN